MSIMLIIGLISCSAGNEYDNLQNLKNAISGLWEIENEDGSYIRWLFLEDGNGEIFDGFVGFQTFTYLIDEESKTINIHGLNGNYHENGDMMIITEIDSKSIIWQNVSRNYEVQKLKKIKSSNQKKDDILKLLIGTWKTTESKNNTDVYFAFKTNGNVTITRVYESSYKINSDCNEGLEYREMTHVGFFSINNLSYYILMLGSENVIKITSTSDEVLTLNKVEGIPEVPTEDEYFNYKAIANQWTGNLGISYTYSYRGREYSFKADYTDIIFYPKTNLDTYGLGKQVDFYNDGPYTYQYYEFYWSVDRGTIYLRYPYAPELNTAISDYRIDNDRLTGRFKGSNSIFTLNKIVDYYDWTPYVEIYGYKASDWAPSNN